MAAIIRVLLSDSDETPLIRYGYEVEEEGLLEFYSRLLRKDKKKPKYIHKRPVLHEVKLRLPKKSMRYKYGVRN